MSEERIEEEIPQEPEAPQEQPAEAAPEAPAEAQAPETIDEPPQIDDAAELREQIEKLNRRQMYLQRQMENRQAPPAAPETPATPAAPNEPKVDDFDSYEAYVDARADFRAKATVQEYIRTHERDQSQAQQEADRQAFIARTFDEGAAQFDDFNDVVSDTTAPITETMVEYAQASDKPTDLLYYLGKNRAQCAAISRMSPVQAARALAGIENEIGGTQTPPPPPRRTVTNAPPPIKPQGAAGTVSKDPSRMSQAEYEAWRRANP